MTPEKPSDPPLQTLEVAGRPVAYREEGSRTAILAVHGLPGSGRDFRWLAPVIAEHGRFVRLDMPGFGETPGPVAAAASVPERAEAVLAFADAMQLERFVVLGHSIGGPVALEVAARHPERVCGVALLASVGLRPHRLLRQFAARPTSWALRVPGVRQLLRRHMRRGFRQAGFSDSTPEQEMERSVHIAAALDFPRHRADVLLLQVPAFVTWAADDPLVEDAVSTELAAACAAEVRLRFDEGGHNIQKSRAVEIGAAFGEWLATAVEPRCADIARGAG